MAAGAVQDTTDVPVAFADVTTVAATPVGALATVAGIAAADEADAGPVPAMFLAVTVNVYDVPFVRPVIVQGFTRTHDTAACAVEPMYGVTVNPVMGAPPLEVGAVHDTTDEAFAFDDATTDVGATGGPIGMTEVDATDTAPVPAELVAVTVNVYEMPFVRPVTAHEVVAVAQVNDPGVDVTV